MYSDEKQRSFLLKEHKIKRTLGKRRAKVFRQNISDLDCLCSVSMDSLRNKYSY